MTLPALAEVRRYRNRMILFVLIGFGGFLAWAAITDLATGVHVMGAVVPDTHRKVIQAQVPGIVVKVLARDGQDLNSGDPILELDPEKLLAEKLSAKRRLVEILFARERYIAELDGRRFQPDIVRTKRDFPEFDVATLARLAQSTAIATAAAQAAELENIRSRLNRNASESVGVELQIKTLLAQKDIAQRKLSGLLSLFKEGLYPRVEVDRQEQQFLDIVSRLDERQTYQTSLRHEYDALKAEQQRLLQDNRKKSGEGLVSMEIDEEQTRARLVQLGKDIASLTVKSPTQGQLIGLSVTTIGSFLNAGQTIGQVVPKDAPLVIEASVSPMDIDRVSVGTVAEIRFTSLPRKVSPMLRGQVVYVSKDVIALTTDASRNTNQQVPGYQIHVLIKKSELAKLGEIEVIPGMPAEVFTDGGTRSVLDYLTSPIAQLFERAMREY